MFLYIVVDGTAYMPGTEQVCLCVRYLDDDSKILREEFLQFLPKVDTTGKGLTNLILQSLQTFGIDVKYLRGRGYDGAN